MSIQRDRGYRLEKAVERILGGFRVGTLGKEDVMHPVFSIECKSRGELPRWLHKMASLINIVAHSPGELPYLSLNGYLVMFRLGDFHGANDPVCMATEERKLPKWITEAIEQCVKNTPVEKLSLIVIHETRWRHVKDICIMRLADFNLWQQLHAKRTIAPLDYSSTRVAHPSG